MEWISDLLGGRKQRVIVNVTCSEWMEMISGVPQGSVLGPLLSDMYYNLPDILLNSGIYFYADDTKVLRIIKDESDYMKSQ